MFVPQSRVGFQSEALTLFCPELTNPPSLIVFNQFFVAPYFRVASQMSASVTLRPKTTVRLSREIVTTAISSGATDNS